MWALGAAAGATDDWYVGNLTAKYGWTFEMRDKGDFGFLLPANQIANSGEENMLAMEVLFNQLITEFGK